MDWNWFFSSLAQCGAALIGIIAAFIISKLLNESEKADSYQNQLKKLKAQYTEIRKRIELLDIGLHNQKVIFSSYELSELIINEQIENKTEEEKENLLHDLGIPYLYRHSSNRKILDLFITAVRNTKRRFNEVQLIGADIWLDGQTHHNYPEYYERLFSDALNIDKHRIEAESLINNFQILNEEIQDKQAGFNQTLIVLFILMAGLFFTVVYPLSYLPVLGIDSLVLTTYQTDLWISISGAQFWMLVLLSLVFEGIFVYFISVVYRLKKKYKDMKADIGDNYLNLWGYSEYFGEKPKELNMTEQVQAKQTKVQDVLQANDNINKESNLTNTVMFTFMTFMVGVAFKVMYDSIQSKLINDKLDWITVCLVILFILNCFRFLIGNVVLIKIKDYMGIFKGWYIDLNIIIVQVILLMLLAGTIDTQPPFYIDGHVVSFLHILLCLYVTDTFWIIGYLLKAKKSSDLKAKMMNMWLLINGILIAYLIPVLLLSKNRSHTIIYVFTFISFIATCFEMKNNKKVIDEASKMDTSPPKSN